MRTASALSHAAEPRPQRPRLALVPPPAPRARVTPRERLAALLSGLTSGFVLAAVAALMGGGSPGASLAAAAVWGAALMAVLARARIVTVRTRRRRAASRAARAAEAPSRAAGAA